MDLQLSGKRALVSGSSTGIGEGIARALAREGVYVAVHGRNAERANRVADEIVRDGGRAGVVLGDLATDAGARQVADGARELLGSVDILINNAGGYLMRGWWDTDAATWSEFYNNDVVSSVRLILQLAPQMQELGWGRIIQISSILGTEPPGLMPYYAASKAAQINLSVSLAKALTGTGITVNTISPGTIVTPSTEQPMRAIAQMRGWGDDLAQIEQRWLSEILNNPPVARLGRVEDVAHITAFLASPLADFISGINVRLDGGATGTVN